MFKRIIQLMILTISLLALATSAIAAEPTKSFFGERNVAIITAAPRHFTQQELYGITPYIRAKIPFPSYSIQSNEIVAYGSIQMQTTDELAKFAQAKQTDLLLFINMPIYEEYIETWFDKDIIYVNVVADIYLYDAQTKQLQIKKLRSHDRGEYGMLASPDKILIRALNQVLEKLSPTQD